jgi:hypothetical protein
MFCIIGSIGKVTRWVQDSTLVGGYKRGEATMKLPRFQDFNAVFVLAEFVPLYGK